jgi:predicted DNA-binding transcriptional regulator YafY
MLNSLNSLDRLNRINKLIKMERTGTPESFASKLNIGKRQLYNILDDFKIMGASIKYCRKRETYYYLNEFDFEVKYSVKVVKYDK